jgi:hypothetical protein
MVETLIVDSELVALAVLSDCTARGPYLELEEEGSFMARDVRKEGYAALVSISAVPFLETFFFPEILESNSSTVYRVPERLNTHW